jgi:hypothetical protein
MLATKTSFPLSRQHQHALALCVRINRASLSSLRNCRHGGRNPAALRGEIRSHFAAEGPSLFPVAKRYPQLAGIVEELISEHAVLRDYFGKAAARSLDRGGLRQFGEILSTHIRKEERQLFEGIQACFNPEELAEAGRALDNTLATASQACIVPTETILRNAKADPRPGCGSAGGNRTFPAHSDRVQQARCDVISDHQTVENVRKLPIYIEAKQFSADLGVLLQQDWETFAIGFDICDRLRQFVQVAEDVAYARRPSDPSAADDTAVEASPGPRGRLLLASFEGKINSREARW